MVNLKEYMKEMMERHDATGKGERLGFCPNRSHDVLISMMWWSNVYDNEAEWIGRGCNECNYVSEYHTNIISNFIDEPLERRLREKRGQKALLKKIYIGHGAVSGARARPA